MGQETKTFNAHTKQHAYKPSPWEDLKAMLARDASSVNRDGAEERLTQTIMDYIGDSSKREAISYSLGVFSSVDSSPHDKQRAAAALNTMMLDAARMRTSPLDPSDLEGRYEIAMAIQELSRDLSHRVAHHEMQKHKDSFFNADGRTQVPLTHVLGSLLQHADLIHLGDTEHAKNGTAQKWLGDLDTIQSLQKNGVKHIFWNVGSIIRTLLMTWHPEESDETNLSHA